MKYKSSSLIKNYLIISLISIIITLYLSEFYFTFINGNNKYPITLEEKAQIYKKITGNEYDTRSKLEFYKDLKSKNLQTSVAVPPFHFIGKKNTLFPLSSKSNTTLVNCNENGYYSTYESDRYGFNNPNSEWDKKEIEFVLIGDSFVHGDCVNRPNDIGSVLRLVSNKSVLNLGQKGNGPLIEYATLREYLKTNVANIIWIFHENDIVNLSYELTSNKLNNYLNDINFNQNLKEKQQLIDSIVLAAELGFFNQGKRATKNLNKNDKKKYKVLKFIRIDKTKKIFKNYFLNDKTLVFAKFKHILKQAKNLSLENGSNLYFVYLPKYPGDEKHNRDKLFTTVKKITKELEIPFLDMNKLVFAKEDNPKKLYPFEKKGHFNIEGYKKITEAIYDFTSD